MFRIGCYGNRLYRIVFEKRSPKLTVNVTGSTAVNNAEVVVRGEGGVYATVANREDGTYTFTLPRASEATVIVSAEGYAVSQTAITVANAATKTYAATVTLTALAKQSAPKKIQETGKRVPKLNN